MKNEIVFYGKIKDEKYETILFKSEIEARMDSEWKKQMVAKCEQLGAKDVRCIEYIGYAKPNFAKAINI